MGAIDDSERCLCLVDIAASDFAEESVTYLAYEMT
jgi:hypothetical protein